MSNIIGDAKESYREYYDESHRRGNTAMEFIKKSSFEDLLNVALPNNPNNMLKDDKREQPYKNNREKYFSDKEIIVSYSSTTDLPTTIDLPTFAINNWVLNPEDSFGQSYQPVNSGNKVVEQDVFSHYFPDGSSKNTYDTLGDYFDGKYDHLIPTNKYKKAALKNPDSVYNDTSYERFSDDIQKQKVAIMTTDEGNASKELRLLPSIDSDHMYINRISNFINEEEVDVLLVPAITNPPLGGNYAEKPWGENYTLGGFVYTGEDGKQREPFIGMEDTNNNDKYNSKTVSAIYQRVEAPSVP